MPRPVTVVVLLWLVGWFATARAAEPFPWSQPPPLDQLAADPTEIPLGKGAILVPSLSGPLNEPPVILVQGDEVRDIPTGSRVIVDPGDYVVIVSPGSPGQGIGTAITVVEGETSLVPVTWGALRVLVTDPRRLPNRNGYDLIRADSGEPLGTGFGADTLQGEQLMTWLLPPGVYLLVKPGANARSLTNYATVYVPPAAFVQYRVVTDPQTGDFLGAGILQPNEFGAETRSNRPWLHTLTLGADGSLVHQNNVAAVANQLLLAGNVFFDGQLAYKRGEHTVSLLAHVEEGATRIQPQNADPLPVVKTRDELRGDLLYTWFVRKDIGPYARAGVETQAFATAVLPLEDTTFLLQTTGAGTNTVFRQANRTLRIADPWTPTVVRQGAGANARVANGRWITLNVRLGLGLRQNEFGGAFVLDDDPDTARVEYLQVDNFNQQGVESTVVFTARLPGWAVYTTNVELFADFDTFTDPAIEWRNTLSSRLSRNLSLNYFADVDYLPQVVDRVQLEHSVVLRASWTLL